MFSRVLKSTTQQPHPQHTASTQPPSSPTKISSRPDHTKSQSTTVISTTASTTASLPSKIPIPASRSVQNAIGAKENQPAPAVTNEKQSNYLSFLYSQSQQGAPTTPVKVNTKIAQQSVPGHHRDDPVPAGVPSKTQFITTAPSLTGRASHATESEDVHMQTMKNTVHPAMLKQLASVTSNHDSVPAPSGRGAVNPHAIQRNGNVATNEDVYMKTAARHDTKSEKERGLQMWERELLEKPDVRRKATVAQICESNITQREISD